MKVLKAFNCLVCAVAYGKGLFAIKM